MAQRRIPDQLPTEAEMWRRLHLALNNVPFPGEWAKRGACVGATTELFFPGRGDNSIRAKAVCAGCPVLAECRDYALAAPDQLVGVWGGTTYGERRQIRRVRNGVRRRGRPRNDELRDRAS